MTLPDRGTFRALASRGNLVPLVRRVFSDQLSPVLGYRRLVAADERTAPSFLLESVENGDKQGRYSFIGAQPSVEVIARRHEVTIEDHLAGAVRVEEHDDPLDVPRAISAGLRPVMHEHLPDAFCGGWVGYAGYDSVRYVEAGKLAFDGAPADDRGLPEVHLGLYETVAVFDHARKMVYAVHWVRVDEPGHADAAYDAGVATLNRFVERLQTHSVPLPAGSIDMNLAQRGTAPARANMERAAFEASVERAREYILAGDVFQVVLSQRFERETTADPFEIYRALRIVNPSPYMIYLQARGSILVASSPEILCRVHDRCVVNRPLAGTRKRGATEEEDLALERELLADDKERAEHIMLVDLGRNDVGRVAVTGSVSIDRMMEIERYSHVMHISSTVTGTLAEGLDSWAALRAALPVGTISGAPKVRAMQIIDELEPTRRGPYGGGIGVVSFDDQMDIALALRTMVVPVEQDEPQRRGDTEKRAQEDAPGGEARTGKRWTIHVQAGAGIVADSVPSSEYEETVNKAAALARAIDLAEAAFGNRETP